MQVEAELSTALEMHDTIRNAVGQLMEEAPELQSALEKILYHAATRSM